MLTKFFTPASVFQSKPTTRVGILRTDHIGDLVYTLPLAHVLKSHQIETVLFCPPYTKEVALACSALNKVMDISELSKASGSENKIDYLIVPLVKDLITYQQTIKTLKQQGVSIISRAQKLLRSYPLSDHLLWISNKQKFHEAQINLSLLAPIIGHINDALPLHKIETALTPDGSQIPHLLETATWKESQFNLLMHLGSHGSGKEWPLNRFHQVIEKLLTDDPKIHIWLTGSEKEERHIKQALTDYLNHPQVHFTFGQFSLVQLMHVIARADGLVSNGTGPLHLAGALGTPCLGLFPATWRIGASRWRPLSNYANTLSATYCPQKCSSTCQCIQQITVDQVVEMIQRRLIHLSQKENH